MFHYLLAIIFPLTTVCMHYDYDCDINHYTLVLYTQILCIANQILKNKSFQLFLHDIFVYCLTYGLLSSTCDGMRVLTMCTAFAMVSTRIIFKRCLFLWWYTERNMDYDMIVTLVAFTNTMRTTSICHPFVCLIVAIYSHFLDVSYNNSYAVKTVRFLREKIL